MNDLRHDPDDGWYTVPDGVKPWGKTVRHVPQPDGTVLTQTNVPPQDAQPVADHDCTTWTERTEKRLALLEDAVNRIADKLTYLLIKLDSDGK